MAARFTPYIVKPHALVPSEPHTLTPDAEAAVRVFLDQGRTRSTLHLSRLNCALMSSGTTLIERLRDVFERKGDLAEVLVAFDALQSILAQERAFARDFAAVRALLAAEGRYTRGA